jgi:hypothetical protein
MVKRSLSSSPTPPSAIERSPSITPPSSPVESDTDFKPLMKKAKSAPNPRTPLRGKASLFTPAIKAMMLKLVMEMAYKQLPFEEISAQVSIPGQVIKFQTYRVDRHSRQPTQRPTQAQPRSPSKNHRRQFQKRWSEVTRACGRREGDLNEEDGERGIPIKQYIQMSSLYYQISILLFRTCQYLCKEPSWRARHSRPFGNHRHSIPGLQPLILVGNPSSIADSQPTI